MASQSPSRPGRRLGRAGLVVAFVIGLGLIWSQTQSLWAASGSAPAESEVLLVNADHPLPADFAPPELVELANLVPVANSDVRVAAEVEKPLRKLFAAARKAGVKRLYVSSGYRTADEQQELWDASDDRSYVQRPGHSEHQTGLAVDLADLRVGAGEFGDSKAGRWLAKHAWKYGFILRYPAGKEEITGISYEPWHFRYVGKRIARTCHEEGLTLEEYLDAH